MPFSLYVFDLDGTLVDSRRDLAESANELLRVSGAIAALSGVYYAISVLTDDRYREEFLEEIAGQLRETFVARAQYLALRAGGGS